MPTGRASTTGAASMRAAILPLRSSSPEQNPVELFDLVDLIWGMWSPEQMAGRGPEPVHHLRKSLRSKLIL
jgi:hypothetical protein